MIPWPFASRSRSGNGQEDSRSPSGWPLCHLFSVVWWNTNSWSLRHFLTSAAFPISNDLCSHNKKLILNTFQLVLFYTNRRFRSMACLLKQRSNAPHKIQQFTALPCIFGTIDSTPSNRTTCRHTNQLCIYPMQINHQHLTLKYQQHHFPGSEADHNSHPPKIRTNFVWIFIF